MNKKLKFGYFKHLLIFLIVTVIITIILQLLHVGDIVLFIGTMVLFTLGSVSYFTSLKDVAEDLNREFSPSLKNFSPLIIFLAISIPITIVIFVLKTSALIKMVGLVILLIFISIVYYLGMRIVEKES